MKTSKLIIAMASMMMLASCGGNNPAPTTDSSDSSAASQAKKTMEFLQDGQFYAYVPDDILHSRDEHIPAIRVNGISINGSCTSTIGAKIELAAEGEFLNDIYVVVAKSSGEGHIAASVYGALEKEQLNEALAAVATAIGTPNKLYISFTKTKNQWFKNLDKEMDEQIAFAWELIAD